ncbi:MAG: sulfotransferase domain-containing protein, partial [Planctomycetales bacterium]
MQAGRKVSYCCSYPKSGRTWLRFILGNYLNRTFELGLDIDFHTIFQLLPNHGLDPQRGLPAWRYHGRGEVPLVIFDHGRFQPRFKRHRVVLLVRSVYDTLVSHYFHVSRRNQAFDGSLSDFVRDSRVGLPRLIKYLNNWAEEIDRCEHLVLSYESLHESPAEVTAQVIEFLSLPLNMSILHEAVEESCFERMRELEQSRGFPNPVLRNDPADVQALRARQGTVGGHQSHLS